MQRRLKSVTAVVLAATLAAAPTGTMAAPPFSRADYEACHARDEAGFRAAIEAITGKAIASGLARVDYRALVADEWRKGGLDELIDKRVDIAVAEVRQETSWSELLKSLAVGDKAQALATSVAERVYRSDAVKSAFEGVAVGVGKQIASTIELATIDAAEPALNCLRAFIGPRYGSAIAGIVAADAEQQFAIDPKTGAAQVSGTNVALEGSGAIAGGVLLAVRRQLSNMAARVGQRLVGSVLSRVVSTVAGGVGLVLIAKDIWDFRYGVLPIIDEEMKSRATKEKVVDELARALGEQMSEHSRDVAAATADRMMTIWQDFRRAHAKVIDLAERHADFRTFLDTTRPQHLPRLDEIVAIVVATEGDDGVLKRLSDGTLHQAVSVMPAAGLDIARETRSVATALGWAAVAGDKLARVVDMEIYRNASPGDFTAATLARVIAVGDKVSAIRLAGIGAEARAALFELDDGELRTLARGLSGDELSTLARYLTGLDRPASQRVLRAVAQSPAKMQVLASPRVRDAIITSADQLAAVGMMLRADTLFAGPFALQDDARLVIEGRVSPILLWEKHPVTVTGLLVATLIVLLALRRLLFGRRRKAATA